MHYIRLLIEYDGTAYHGWQSQKAGGTIQDMLVAAISSITGSHVRLTGASRTDAGVHALGQVAVFGTDSGLSPDVIGRALNSKLPGDIRILGSEYAPEDFHPRYDAKSKSYFYIISKSRVQSVFLQRYCWHVKADLDMTALKTAAATIEGEHDFSSFMGSGCGSRHQVRTVFSCKIEALSEIGFMTASISGDFVKIRIEANAFLRHMVRNIVGTLAEVGKGRISTERFVEILEGRDRRLAGPTAPACGLFLERIIY